MGPMNPTFADVGADSCPPAANTAAVLATAMIRQTANNFFIQTSCMVALILGSLFPPREIEAKPKCKVNGIIYIIQYNYSILFQLYRTKKHVRLQDTQIYHHRVPQI